MCDQLSNVITLASEYVAHERCRYEASIADLEQQIKTIRRKIGETYGPGDDGRCVERDFDDPSEHAIRG